MLPPLTSPAIPPPPPPPPPACHVLFHYSPLAKCYGVCVRAYTRGESRFTLALFPGLCAEKPRGREGEKNKRERAGLDIYAHRHTSNRYRINLITLSTCQYRQRPQHGGQEARSPFAANCYVFPHHSPSPLLSPPPLPLFPSRSLLICPHIALT
jgi:hypothetical protein